jgi:hypothetical protein
VAKLGRLQDYVIHVLSSRFSIPALQILHQALIAMPDYLSYITGATTEYWTKTPVAIMAMGLPATLLLCAAPQ